MDLQEIAQKALISGRISGKAFMIETYLKNTLEILSWHNLDTQGLIEDALKEIKEIRKLTKKL